MNLRGLKTKDTVEFVLVSLLLTLDLFLFLLYCDVNWVKYIEGLYLGGGLYTGIIFHFPLSFG